MKKLLASVILLLTSATVFAQFDEQFYQPSKEVVEPEGLVYREIFIDREGDIVNAIFITAQGNPKATVLFFHGNALNLWQGIYNIRPLLENGYNVVMWDYRGFGKSSGTPTHVNIAGDAQVIFDAMMETDETKGLPVIIYGSSIGGHSATLIAKNNKDKIQGLVLDGAAKSFTDLALLTAPDEYREVIKQFVTSPYSIEKDIMELDGVKTLFIHSEEDFIPYEGAVEMYESAGEPKRFWKYEGKHIQAAVIAPGQLVENVDWLLE